MSQDLEEMRQLLALQREVARQRLRTATAEAWVDDVAKKMAINRAVYCAGYEIAPKPESVPTRFDPSQQPPSPAVPSETPAAPSPAAPSPVAPSVVVKSMWGKVWPWLLAAGIGTAGVGSGYLLSGSEQPSVSPSVEFPKYDVEKWVPTK